MRLMKIKKSRFPRDFFIVGQSRAWRAFLESELFCGKANEDVKRPEHLQDAYRIS